jgi:hypothetical protein
VYSRELCAAFYADRTDDRSDEDSLRRIGVEKTWVGQPAGEYGPDSPEVRFASWAGLDCEVRTVDVDDYRVQLLVFRQQDFLALVDDGNADELADAFRRACEALRPKIAFLLALPQFDATGFPDTEGYVARQADLVLAWASDELAASQFGLLYLGPDYASFLGSDLDGRDELPVADGRLLFAGTGQYRWSG